MPRQAALENAVAVFTNDHATLAINRSRTLESFEQPGVSTGDNALSGKYALDIESTNTGCSDGVVQQLTVVTDLAKVGKSAGCYEATSTRADNAGWSYKSKPLKKPIDLTDYSKIGFWLHRDGNGQQFKLQLRDTEGGWQDMYIPVTFRGWQFLQFDLGGPNLKKLDSINAINLSFNGLPGGRTVTCHIDGIRVMHDNAPLKSPSFESNGKRIRFPIVMNAGDRLVFRNMDNCQRYT